MNDQLYGLVWYTAYEEYEIMCVYRNEEAAKYHAKIMKDVLKKNNVEDEDFKVVKVRSDGKDWVEEIQ